MRTTIITRNDIVGFHHYPNAPQWCAYLEEIHRHVFVVKCHFVVQQDREIEFNQMQLNIEEYLHKTYGNPCQFGGMSCESIAKGLCDYFDCDGVEVSEDGYAGAFVTK